MRLAVCILLLACAVARADSTSDVARAIGELGASKFATREAGGRELMGLAADGYSNVLNQCIGVYKQTDDPEVKFRLRAVMEQIVDKYKYRAPRGFLGIKFNNVNNVGGHVIINGVEAPTGSVWVGGVIDGTAAQKAGIQANDFVMAIDGRFNWKTEEFTKCIQAKSPGTHVILKVVRGEATNDLDLVLGDLPADVREQMLSEEGSHEYFRKWLIEQAGKPTSATNRPAGE